MGGFNLPPGCTSGDIERACGGDCEICYVCGNHYDHCLCPECPVCEEQGNPNCYKQHGLVKTQEQILSLAHAEALEEDASIEENKQISAMIDEEEKQEAMIEEWIENERKNPSTCPHGKPLGECHACDVAADIAFDAARERR